MNNPIESPKGPKNIEPLSQEEIDKLDAITLEDHTALDKLIDAAQNGDIFAMDYITHTRNPVAIVIGTVSPQRSTEVKTQPRKK